MEALLERLENLRKRAMLSGAVSAFDPFASGSLNDGLFVDLSDKGQAESDIMQALQDFSGAKSQLELEIKFSNRKK